jgi:hypothetical protein
METLTPQATPSQAPPPAEPTVYRYADSESMDAFNKHRDTGEICEVDEEMFYYFLEVLPPVYMGKNVEVKGQMRRVAYGFAEGFEEVVVFWTEGTRYFCAKTSTMNPYA